MLRKVAGDSAFVVVNDRVELDDQIAKTFKATGAVGEAEGDQCHAASGAHLRDLLRGNHRYVFTLIYQFQPERRSAGLPLASSASVPLVGLLTADWERFFVAAFQPAARFAWSSRCLGRT